MSRLTSDPGCALVATFLRQVPDFLGQHVKAADKDIKVRLLLSIRGRASSSKNATSSDARSP